jgi:hypothetical protein
MAQRPIIMRTRYSYTWRCSSRPSECCDCSSSGSSRVATRVQRLMANGELRLTGTIVNRSTKGYVVTCSKLHGKQFILQDQTQS